MLSAPELRLANLRNAPFLGRRVRSLWAFISLAFVVVTLLATGCADTPKSAPTDPGIELLQLPVITAHPRDTSVIEGGTVTFTVAATGALTYTWVNGIGDTLKDDTTATLTLTNIPLSAHGANYRCVVGNADGTVASQLAYLTVQMAPVPLNPRITSQPVSSIIIPGGSTLLTVTATGPGITYQWYRGNLDNPISEGKSATLVVTRVPWPGVAEKYYCILGNTHGSLVTDTVTVRADAPRSLLLDTGRVIFAGHCAGCHGSTGRGVAGTVPPVTNADYLMQNRQRGLEIILAGASDSMLVNGMWYQAAMPAYADSLSDVQIAAVLTYIRAGLNDSIVNSCNPNQLDANGFPVCQKTPRTPQAIAADSVSYQEVFGTRGLLFPL